MGCEDKLFFLHNHPLFGSAVIRLGLRKRVSLGICLSFIPHEEVALPGVDTVWEWMNGKLEARALEPFFHFVNIPAEHRDAGFLPSSPAQPIGKPGKERDKRQIE